MRSRTIRRAAQERAIRADLKILAERRQEFKLGVAIIEPDAVLQAAPLEPVAGDRFLNQLPRRPTTVREAEALAPLLQSLQHVRDGHEYHRLQGMTAEELEAIDGART